MMARQSPPAPTPDREESGELRDFMLVVREGLLLIVRYIERRYGKAQSPH